MAIPSYLLAFLVAFSVAILGVLIVRFIQKKSQRQRLLRKELVERINASPMPGLFSTLRPQLTEPLERFVNSDMRAQYKFGNSRLKKQLDANVSPLCPPLWDD